MYHVLHPQEYNFFSMTTIYCNDYTFCSCDNKTNISTLIHSVFLSVQIKQKGEKKKKNSPDFSFAIHLKNYFDENWIFLLKSILKKRASTRKADEFTPPSCLQSRHFPTQDQRFCRLIINIPSQIKNKKKDSTLMHVEEHLMMSCCKIRNDAPVFFYFNLGGISLIVKSVNTFIFLSQQYKYLHSDFEQCFSTESLT